MYEETLTGRPHDTSVQTATSDNEMWMQFNFMPRTIYPCVIIYVCVFIHHEGSNSNKKKKTRK